MITKEEYDKKLAELRKKQAELDEVYYDESEFMDHTSYEWSQWWHKAARKPKRWKK